MSVEIVCDVCGKTTWQGCTWQFRRKWNVFKLYDIITGEVKKRRMDVCDMCIKHIQTQTRSK